jgi:nucleoside-diphosphate-sugar epimerase
MKVVVTGGTGFLGRHVVWRMAREGAEVVFTGRSEAEAATVQRHAAAPVRWQPLVHGRGDAAGVLSRIAEQADVLVHSAALSAPWGRADAFRRANVDGTAEVLQACSAAGVPRLVHISTPSLYFDFRDRLAIREDEPLPPPVNHYARTKAEAEALVRAAPPPQAVLLRPRALFGPWDQTLMPRLLRVLQRGALPLMNGGRAQLDLTCIDNAVDAVWLAATRPLPHALATYNVSNGEPQTLLALLQAMAHAFGLPLRTRRVPWPLVKGLACGLEAVAHLRPGHEPLMTRYSAGVLAFSQTLDIGALRRDLGYVPKVSIAEGLRRHADWWRTHGAEATR